MNGQVGHMTFINFDENRFGFRSRDDDDVDEVTNSLNNATMTVAKPSCLTIDRR